MLTTLHPLPKLALCLALILASLVVFRLSFQILLFVAATLVLLIDARIPLRRLLLLMVPFALFGFGFFYDVGPVSRGVRLCHADGAGTGWWSRRGAGARAVLPGARMWHGLGRLCADDGPGAVRTRADAASSAACADGVRAASGHAHGARSARRTLAAAHGARNATGPAVAAGPSADGGDFAGDPASGLRHPPRHARRSLPSRRAVCSAMASGPPCRSRR